jgi:hypothetical protein
MLLMVGIALLDCYNKRQVQLLTVVDNRQKYAESNFHQWVHNNSLGHLQMSQMNLFVLFQKKPQSVNNSKWSIHSTPHVHVCSCFVFHGL